MIPLIGIGALLGLLAGVAIYLSVQYKNVHYQGYWRLIIATFGLIAGTTSLQVYLIIHNPAWFNCNHPNAVIWKPWVLGGPLHLLAFATILGWLSVATWGFLNKK